MNWSIFALIASLAFCVQSELNKHYKVDGLLLNAGQSFIAIFLLAPFIPFMEWPSSIEYYFVVFLCGLMSILSQTALYNLASNKNGRVACLYQPLSVVLIFFIWNFIEPSQLDFLLSSPYRLVAVITAFILFLGSFQFIRRNDSGLEAFIAVIPIAILFTIGTVLTKLFLEAADSPMRIALNFVFLLSVIMFIFSLPMIISRHLKTEKLTITQHFIKACFFVSVFHTFSWVMFNVAIVLSPNPAYVSILDGLIPVWFMIYYRLRGIEDRSSPISGMVMGFAAILILIATN